MRPEFEFINDLKSRYSLTAVGDDCAVLTQDEKTDLLVTADLLVEDIDFRLEWTTPEFLGHKALAVSLSDVAAMGGVAKWALVSVAISEKLWKTDFLDRFYAGWHDLARKYGVELVGGDVSRSPDRLMIDSVVGGEIAKGRALLRSTAKPRDLIYVTGTLGGAAGGLRLLEKGERYHKDNPKYISNLMLRQLKPQPELEVAKLLGSHSICTSAIDISDGLSSDLAHICEASNVGARIYAESLPIHPNLAHYFPHEECLELALHGGEDFGLLYTTMPEHATSAVGTHIGEITSDQEIILADESGVRGLRPHGFRHF